MTGDSLRRVLYIDLKRRRYYIEDKTELFQESLGGAGVAIRLLEEECPQGVEPLGPDNPIIFAVGPLTGLFPLASKTVAMFKSPLTGNLGESHAGGRSAMALRLAGYGAVVIKGSSETPIYLAIHGDKVSFQDASALWGVASSFTVGRVLREREPGAGQRAIMRIGRAGERLVCYACVVTETYRHFGRMGLGAVFGSKKLKAIVVSGSSSIHVASPKLYREAYDEIYQAAVESPVMQKYHELGTAGNIEPLNAIGGLPTMNLKQARFDSAREISGESFAGGYLGRRIACSHCPVACIHIASLREPYESEPYFYKTSMISYDYELIYALGSMLGNSDIRAILKLMDGLERLGLDAISTGVVLAWATEALERGLVSTEHTAGVELAWGNHDNYSRASRLLVEQPNEFYSALAQGVEYASAKYGGTDFALAFAGNEMAGYHTGPAAYAGYLMGSRHSHLDSAGYSLDQKALASGKQPTPGETAEALTTEEAWRQILSSAVVCFFARGIYTPDTMAKALKVMGYDLTPQALVQIGEDVLRRKYAFKLREGFCHSTLRIPGRILETPSSLGTISEAILRETMARMDEKLRLSPPAGVS